MVCLALELIGPWVVVGFRVGMEAFGCSLINKCSLESGVFWCSQVWGLNLLPLVFSLILPVASRLLHPYSTDNKTSRLMVKRFSTMRDTQRCSELPEEEERVEGDRCEQEEKRGELRGERQI